MNYTRIYDEIILSSKNRNLDCYNEKHHIIPRCIGGSNEDYNIVCLTPREHFLCHYLLTKIHYGNYKLLRAFIGMCRPWTSRYHNQIRYIPKSSSLYEKCKISLYGKNGSCIGKKHPCYGHKHTDEAKQKMSKAARQSWASGSRKKAVRQPHTDEAKQKMSKAKQGIYEGGNNPFAKKCYIDGVIYGSATEAAKVFNINPATLQYRLRSNSDKFKNMHYITN